MSKAYVHSENGMRDVFNLMEMAKDGSESMEGNIDLENHKINLGTPTNKDNIANKEYVETEISKVDNKNIQVLDGSKKMSKDLDVNNKDIINLKEPQPSNSYYAVNVNFVNKTIANNNASITSYYKKNKRVLMINSNI